MTTLPAGPTPDPELLRALDGHPLTTLDRLGHAHGDLFTVRATDRPDRVYVSEPAAMHEMFIEHGPDLAVVGSSLFKMLIGDDALIFIHGEPHRRARQLLSPPLLGNRMRAYGPSIQQITEQVAGTVSQPVPLIGVTREIALRIITRVLFGPLPPDRAGKVWDLAATVLDLMHSLGPQAAREGRIPEKFQELYSSLDEFIDAEASRLRSDPDPDRLDVLAHLVTVDDPPTADDIRTHMITLLIGGHESTASALAWALYLVHLHPEVHNRLLAELKTGPPEDLPYLKAVCDEVLRYASIVPSAIARQTTTELTAAGHRFPEGTELVPCPHLVHRREQVFDNPHTFDPSRFLGVRFSTVDFMPFGIGLRRCLGAALGTYELQIALATLVDTCRLQITAPAELVEPVALGPTVSLPTSVIVSPACTAVSES